MIASPSGQCVSGWHPQHVLMHSDWRSDPVLGSRPERGTMVSWGKETQCNPRLGNVADRVRGLLGAVSPGFPQEGISKAQERISKVRGAGQLCLKAKDSVIRNQSMRQKYCRAILSLEKCLEAASPVSLSPMQPACPPALERLLLLFHMKCAAGTGDCVVQTTLVFRC